VFGIGIDLCVFEIQIELAVIMDYCINTLARMVSAIFQPYLKVMALGGVKI
jgi:hypothetical protein